MARQNISQFTREFTRLCTNDSFRRHRLDQVDLALQEVVDELGETHPLRLRGAVTTRNWTTVLKLRGMLTA